MPLNDAADVNAIILRLASDPRDSEQWRLLHIRLWPYVMALNYRRFGGAHEVAEDASQEVFLRLVRYAPFERIKGAAAFYAYVRKVCANVAADYRLQIGRLREVQALEELTLEHPESQRLDLSVEADRLKEELLSQLTDTDQRLAQLILEGFSLNEIAETLGIGYSSAGVRVHRLRQRMAKLLR